MRMKWPSSKVRETFIKYFQDQKRLPHLRIPSSSVIPLNDPSLAFVNAGMNQFKDAILNREPPPCSRMTNSQKCIRISDLDLVGRDTYHHTFFEMLGNWSFSDYFKKEACEMAWDLLVNTYKLPHDRLYFTYFGGEGHVPPDLEVKQIWENIGVPSSRILPFVKDNFWSMASVGPCGPSTEIHYDHRGSLTDPSLVNKDHGEVVEIWNLVFMQYNRLPDGSLERLKISNVVDTGAGLERLTAVLNKKISNYDTDLFQPIFEKIFAVTNGLPRYGGDFNSNLDTSYRIMADHLRAIHVALSDGVLLQERYKIRKLTHRVFEIMEKSFLLNLTDHTACMVFITEASLEVIMSLMGHFKEMLPMLHQNLTIIDKELARFCLQRKGNGHVEKGKIPLSVLEQFPALSRITKSDLKLIISSKAIDGPTSYKWYDSLGVIPEATEELAASMDLKFDKEDFQKEAERLKKQTRDDTAQEILFDNESLALEKILSCLRNSNEKKDLRSSSTVILNIFTIEGDEIESTQDQTNFQSYYLVLSESPFKPADYMLESDQGSIVLANGENLDIASVKSLPFGFILHKTKGNPKFSVRKGTTITKFEINEHNRKKLTDNSKSYDALKLFISDRYGVVRFRNPKICSTSICFELNGIHDEMFEIEEVALWNRHLDDHYHSAVIVEKKQLKYNSYYIKCSVDKECEKVRRAGKNLEKDLRVVHSFVNVKEYDGGNLENVRMSCRKIKEAIYVDKIVLPYDIRISGQELLKQSEKMLGKAQASFELDKFSRQIAELPDPVVIKHFFSETDFLSINKLIQSAGERPVLVVVSREAGFIHAKCYVPKVVAEHVTAEQWLNRVREELERGKVSSLKEQDEKSFAVLRKMRISTEEKEKLFNGLIKAKDFIESKLQNQIFMKEIKSG